MVLPEVPGIIEAAMTVTAEPDGRVSFRVLVGGGRSSGCDVVELIISPEHVRRALVGGMKQADERPAFPCHIGFYSDAAHSAA
jgi:hypothetical protein